MTKFYLSTEPYDQGMLDVGENNHMYWEVCGNPNGKPALVVHGGPGSGCSPHYRRYFDPDRYRVVLFDQRGCGRSIPSASDPATDISCNTTEHLLGDMEQLRNYLDIERWLLFGGSWGSTLALAYAERYPNRVSEIVISPVTTTRRSEIDWLYQGVSRFLPEEWERFRSLVADADDSKVVAAYAHLMHNPDPQVRTQAADEWCMWEDAVLSHELEKDSKVYGNRPPDAKVSFVRIATHYFANNAWLEREELLRNADRLSGISGILIHGRFDLAAPLNTAWELDRAWSDAELIVIDDSGHIGNEKMEKHKRDALDGFAQE